MSPILDEQLLGRLAEALGDQPAGRCSNGTMSPELSYGRHAGPAPSTARPAAVLLLLFAREGRWHVPLTVRPDHMTRHRNQISLPGGMVETDESSDRAALRELAEELGPQTNLTLLGQLPSVYVYASNCDVTPWVAAAATPPTWVPSPAEVARVIEMPLDTVATEARGAMDVRYGKLHFRAPCYQVGQDRIWGATAVVLSELCELLGRIND